MASLAAVTGQLASLTKGVPTLASVQSSGLSPIQKFIKNGIPVQWLGLFFLAGGLPFQPFSFLGYGGMNLFAVGSTVWGATKAGLQAMCLLASKLISAYYPSLWYISWLIVLNPWYIFDLVQMFSPSFNAEGFKVPFLGTKVGNAPKKDETGRFPPMSGTVTPTMLASGLGLLCTGAYSLLEYLPSEIVAAYKPALQTLILVVGSTTALAGGGLGAFAVLPQVMAALKTNTGQISTAFATPAPVAAKAPAAPIAAKVAAAPVAPAAPVAAAPVVAAPVAAAPVAPVAQKGGSSLPQAKSLTDIANNILNKNNSEQTGGGKGEGPDVPTTLFLGALAMIILGGVSLGVVRAKALAQESE